MDNRNRDSADQWPTQQLWPVTDSAGSGSQAAPSSPAPASPAQGARGVWGSRPTDPAQSGWGAGPAGPVPPGSTPPGGPAGPPPPGREPRRIGRGTRWAAGLATAAVLVGGGAALAASGRPAGATGQAAGATGQAATLNTVLSSADSPTRADAAAASPTPAASHAKRGAACAKAAAQLKAAHHTTAARRVRAACRGRLARLRLMVRGIHGQFTFQTKKGAVKTLAFERGKVTSVTSSSVTVAAADGTTWTWHLVSNSVIRQDRKKATAGSLADGQAVFVGGPVVSGANDARLIAIRPATSAAPAS